MQGYQQITRSLPVLVCLLSSGFLQAQNTVPADALRAILDQMKELHASLGEVREQLADSRRESEKLRLEVQALRERLDSPSLTVASETARPQSAQLSQLLEEQKMLNAKVEDHDQTKVESSSHYRVRFSGMALMGVVNTRGAVDNMDLPGMAEGQHSGDAGGSFGASVRQSILGFEVFGPRVAGARASGSVKFDFFGGFPGSPYGTSAAIVRMRTASFRLDWKNTSVTAGQEQPFFSPLSPTSLASVAYPALSHSGNLWSWTPQVFVEHRKAVSENSKLVMQWGILDSFSGEPPPEEYLREPLAGEYGRIPAQAGRLAWQRTAGDRVFSIGAGGYWAKQDWGFQRRTNAWAAAMDWQAPLGRWFSLSGELYRGRSIAGLGGGANTSILFRGAAGAVSSGMLPLSATGGWSELKFKPLERLEFNAAFGQNSPFHPGLGRLLATGEVQGGSVSRNASGFLNTIYQLRSNLLISLEYRRLWTARFQEGVRTADHIALSGGIIF